MRAFQYVTAQSARRAPQLLGETGRYLAGGMDLLGEMKEDIVEPKTLVNIKALPGLNQIEPGNDRWTIGANVTVAELEDHAALKQTFPVLHQAAAEVGSRQIRNLATVGGNLAQHARCWYYRHRDILCLKKEGAMCYARESESRYHSLVSGNNCINPLVSNLAIALAALNASVVLLREGDEIRWSLPELYARAWENPMAHHSLLPGDLLLRAEIPTGAGRSAYQQVSEKSAFDWALVSCAAAVSLAAGKVSQARIFLGAVAPTPYTSKQGCEFLAGKALDETTAVAAADLFFTDAKPTSQNAYKIPMGRALIRRTLLQLRGPA